MASREWLERMQRMRHRLDQRITEYNKQHHRRFSRRRIASVLRNDEPRLSSIVRAAREVGTTVGDLLDEQLIGQADRQKLEEFVGFLVARFDLMGIHAAAQREVSALAVTEEEFIERDFDYPRPHHVWVVPHERAAAGGGIETDRDTETTEVLHSIRDVYNGQLRVIRVIGDSMTSVLHDGDKVTFDIRLREPRDGDVVVVYDSVRGGIIGYWRGGEGGEFWLDKENDAFDSERLEPGANWTVWGKVTRIVDTPVHPRHRRRR